MPVPCAFCDQPAIGDHRGAMCIDCTRASIAGKPMGLTAFDIELAFLRSFEKARRAGDEARCNEISTTLRMLREHFPELDK